MKMSLDKFGRHSRKQAATSYSKSVLPHTPEGDIDAENLRICNLKPPIDKNDATTKEYIDNLLLIIKNTKVEMSKEYINNLIAIYIDKNIIIRDIKNDVDKAHDLLRQQETILKDLQKQYKLWCYRNETCVVLPDIPR